MKEAIAQFIGGLTFGQGLALISLVFGLLIALVMAIALFARISGVEKISKDGIEFDPDGKPVPQNKRLFKRKTPAKK